MMNFVGIDISANHGAFVEIDETGLPIRHTAFTFKACDGKLPGVERLKASKGDKQMMAWSRLWWIGQWIARVKANFLTGRWLCIEDYAFNAKAGGHSVAQVGGLLRYAIMTQGGPAGVRMHPPGSINLYTGCPAGDKTAIRAAVIAMHPEAAALPQDTEGDLIDAYVMARLMALEFAVRAGRVNLESLTDGQRRIFLRTTKAYPENLLMRPLVEAV